MLQNTYLLAKIGADAAKNEQHFVENLPKICNYPTGPLMLLDLALADAPLDVRAKASCAVTSRNPTRTSTGPTYFANFCKFFAKFCKFLAGSFSAVPKRNFARKYAFDSIFQALQDLHIFAPLQSQIFRKKSVWKFSKNFANVAKFAKCCQNFNFKNFSLIIW